MSTSQHTPTPWTLLPWNNDRNPEDFQIGTDNDTRAIYRGPASFEAVTRANAEFIVRACNSHEALVKLAERCAGLNEHNPEIGAGMLITIVTEAREALKLAKP